MSEDIPYHAKLLVISDTGMFQKNNSVYGFGPVVKELEALVIFKSIKWIGFNRPDQVDNNAYLPIRKKNLGVKLLKASGGKRLKDKFLILLYYPYYFFSILKEIYGAEYIHVRAPSNPAVIAIILSFFFPQKQFWFKYAGDWVGKTAVFYQFQRYWLKKLNNNSKVSVNGLWNNQPENVINFENPCLDKSDRENGLLIIGNKKLSTPIHYCFVGGLNENKGCLLFLQAIAAMNLSSTSITLHIVGDGDLKNQLEGLASKLAIAVLFYGSIPKNEVAKIYNICHFIVLPSQSEGFPKVIGEAMNYGCIPIVSNISCIAQYIIHKENGILIEDITPRGIITALAESFQIQPAKFNQTTYANYKRASCFTYDYYNNRIENEIFKMRKSLKN